MAKAKKSTNNSKQKFDQEILIIVYALCMITLSIIGILKLGVFGELLTKLMTYLFGYLANILYAAIIGVGLMMLFKWKFKEIKARTIVGIGCYILALLIFISAPADKSLTGMSVFTNYFSATKDFFSNTLITSIGNGGLVGALIYGLLSALVDYQGSLIVIVALVILGLIMFFSTSFVKNAFSGVGKLFGSTKKALTKPKKVKLKTAPTVYEEDLSEEESGQNFFNFDDLHVDENVVVQEDVVSIQPTIVPVEEEKSETKSSFIVDYANYRLPSLNLLNNSTKGATSKSNKEQAQEAGERLIQILDEFGVKATLIETHIGPSVTKFEIKPDMGVKVSKISNLQNDIKMALAAKDIRIEAPIPSKSAVGIEIPNIDKTLVNLKELLRMVPAEKTNSKLLFALGKDLLGQPVYAELNKMPHLLIAGATGSGKSVCVNSIIISIIMRAKPDEVKMLLIDPKKVEFTNYTNLPHLIGPIINDGEEASKALKAIVEEMDMRYDLFSSAGVRNIASYNSYLEAHPEEKIQKLPWIVVIIDELADLMVVAAKDVEASIQRITQLARAAGIHLIVATQRPSVDVITGLIKANIPSRIAFAVSSAIDSRTILDQHGAEKLLGMGDMLYVPIGENGLTRVQGVYVSDEEVARVCDACSKQGRPKYNDAFIRLQISDSGANGMVMSDDPLYEEVKEFIIETQKASTSYVQRKYSIGYQRAARLIDMLESNGIVGPSRGSKPREVYAKPMDDDELN